MHTLKIKFLVITIFFVSGLNCWAQKVTQTNTEVFKIIEEDLGKGVVLDLNYDGCYFHQTLLKISINKKSKVQKIYFADKTDEWLKNELLMLSSKGRIRLTAMDSVAKKEKLKNCEILIPFVVQFWDYPCNESQNKFRITNETYSFDGQLLKGNVVFCKEINLILYMPPKR